MPEGCRGCCMMVILVPLLICTLIVCVAIYVQTNGPDAPLGDNFRPSQSEANAFNDEIARGSNTAATQGWFAFRFTQEQLSSWLALQGADFADQYDYTFPFEDIQAGIDNGQISFYANVNQAGINIPLEITIEPQVDRDGHLDLAIDAASLAGVPLPSFILDSVTNEIETKLFETINTLPGDYEVYPSELRLEDGQLTMQGRIR